MGEFLALYLALFTALFKNLWFYVWLAFIFWPWFSWKRPLQRIVFGLVTILLIPFLTLLQQWGYR